MPTLFIDQKRATVEEGATVLHAARALGLRIPTLCHRDGLDPAASCMVCAVKIEGFAALQPACATRALEGMRVESDSEPVRAARAQALELLLSDHVGDCIAPCQWACPAGLSVPALVRSVASPDTADIRIPDAVPCHACPAPCERACRRARLDHAVSIRLLLRHRVPDAVPLPDKKAPRDFSVHMGGLSDEEYKRLTRDASPEDRVEPSDASAGFSADEAGREARRCLHCDCRKADHCALRDLSREYAARPGAWRGGPRRLFEQDAEHPLILYESGKCIACGICLKIAAAAGEPYGLTFVERGFAVRMAPALGKPMSQALQTSAAACAEACPTGALVLKGGDA